MKNSILTLFITFSILGFTQENVISSILESDDTWSKEIIKFPINFAPEINYEGFEDLRFPPGWSKQDSPEFWSYVWVWSINDKRGITDKELESDIQFYFDGLMGLDFYKIDEKKVQKSNAVFIKYEALNDTTYFKGKVKTFDTRFTKKPMTLYTLIESYYCEKENKTLILFRFSSGTFEDDVWETLKAVKLIKTACAK